jgi:hypothetical protein
MTPELTALVEKVEGRVDFSSKGRISLELSEALALVSHIRKMEQAIERLNVELCRKGDALNARDKKLQQIADQYAVDCL